MCLFGVMLQTILFNLRWIIISLDCGHNVDGLQCGEYSSFCVNHKAVQQGHKVTFWNKALSIMFSTHMQYVVSFNLWL